MQVRVVCVFVVLMRGYIVLYWHLYCRTMQCWKHIKKKHTKYTFFHFEANSRAVNRKWGQSNTYLLYLLLLELNVNNLDFLVLIKFLI